MTEQEVKKIIFDYLRDHVEFRTSLDVDKDHGFVTSVDLVIDVYALDPDTGKEEWVI